MHCCAFWSPVPASAAAGGRQRMLAAFLSVLVATGVGCGKARATVSGRVLFNGEPLPAGTVIFMGDDNRTASGVINDKGLYIIPGAPVGRVRILVDSRPPLPSIALGPPTKKGRPAGTDPEPRSIKPEGKQVSIPERYGQLKSSGLTYIVRKGEQTYDITLEP